MINAPTKISHPMANRISIQNGPHHYCTPGKSSEIAFFMGKQWVTEVIPEFAEYADTDAGDTRVYGWVPNELIENFLQNFGENT